MIKDISDVKYYSVIDAYYFRWLENGSMRVYKHNDINEVNKVHAYMNRFNGKELPPLKRSSPAICTRVPRQQRYVYFIGFKMHHDAPIKIGATNNVGNRLSTIQTSNPYELECLMSKEVCDGFNEVIVHEKFSHLRLKGEWFQGSEIIDYINEIKE